MRHLSFSLAVHSFKEVVLGAGNGLYLLLERVENGLFCLGENVEGLVLPVVVEYLIAVNIFLNLESDDVI